MHLPPLLPSLPTAKPRGLALLHHRLAAGLLLKAYMQLLAAGTTGKPKMIIHTHLNVYRWSLLSLAALDMKPGGRPSPVIK